MRPGILEQVAPLLPSHNRGFVYGRVMFAEYGVERDTERTNVTLACRNVPHQAIFYGRELFDLLGRYSLRYPIFADHPLNIRAFADPRIEVKYLDLVMTDFEGFGLSSTAKDPALRRDLPGIVRRAFGWRVALPHTLYHFGWQPMHRRLRVWKRALLKLGP